MRWLKPSHMRSRASAMGFCAARRCPRCWRWVWCLGSCSFIQSWARTVLVSGRYIRLGRGCGSFIHVVAPGYPCMGSGAVSCVSGWSSMVFSMICWGVEGGGACVRWVICEVGRGGFGDGF